MKKSVWVIDDDEIYQLIIKKLIRRSKIFEETHYFKSASEVFELQEQKNIQLPDVILLDINMPQMDGWQFIDKLKAIDKQLTNHTMIYIVSSSIAYSDKERVKEYPEVSGFLSKPITVKKIVEIGEAVNRKSPA